MEKLKIFFLHKLVQAQVISEKPKCSTYKFSELVHKWKQVYLFSTTVK